MITEQYTGLPNTGSSFPWKCLCPHVLRELIFSSILALLIMELSLVNGLVFF